MFVTNKTNEELCARVLNGGIVGKNKAITVMKDIPLPPLSTKDIEAIKIGESIQLGFKMSQPVENFEFYHNNTQELLIALRFPLSNVLASMEEDRPVVSMQTSQINSVSKVFYLLGSSIIGLEILNSKSNESWKISIGLSVIFIGYLYEHFIVDKKE